MALVRWKNSGDLMPWSAFSDLQGELNRLMEDFTYDWNALGRNWRPPMDLVETQDAYVLEADVPGVKRPRCFVHRVLPEGSLKCVELIRRPPNFLLRRDEC